MKRRLFNAANALTLSRFVFAPIVLWLILKLTPDAPRWTSASILAVIVCTMLTDLLDGMVARACNVVTDFGKIMDPVADSTFFMTLLFAFSACPRFDLPIWIPILILWREVAMQVLRRYAALRGVVLAAKASGKAKMAVQCLAMSGFALLLTLSDYGYYRLDDARLDQILLCCGIAVVAVNLLSLVEYLREVPVLVREWRGEADVTESADEA